MDGFGAAHMQLSGVRHTLFVRNISQATTKHISMNLFIETQPIQTYWNTTYLNENV